MASGGDNFAGHVVRGLTPGVVGLLFCAAAFGQRYPVLPVPNSPHDIYTMMQDSKSRLWLGTMDNAVAFDGANFYALRQYGFPNETPNAFAEDSEGGIWIGTQGSAIRGGAQHGGLYRYHAGHVERILTGDVLSVAGAAPGIMLASFGTEATGPVYGDLYRLKKGTRAWVAEKVTQKLVNHMTVDHQGNVLFPCPGGWCEVTRTQIVNWPGPGVTLPVNHHPGDPLAERVLRDRFSCVWFRAEIHGGYQCPGDAQPTVLPYLLSQVDASAHLEEGPDGSVFMLVPLILGRPGAFKKALDFPSLGGLQSALIAQDGTIGLAGDNGLFRFMYPFRLEYWIEEDGLAGGVHLFIRRIGDRVYSTGSEIAFPAPNRLRWTTIPGTGKRGQVEDIADLHDGRILVASHDGTTVYRLDGEVLARSPGGTGQGHRLAETSDGQLWLGGDGVSRISLRHDGILVTPERLPRDPVPDLQYDATHDVLWACSGRRVLFYKNGVWRSISRQDGLLDADCYSVAPHPNGDLWLGYAEPAYAVIHNPSSDHPAIHNLTGQLNELVGSNSVKFLGVDLRGRVWRGTNGVSVATPASAEAGEWIFLDEHDGVIGPSSSAFLADSDGSVWTTDAGRIMHFSLPDNFATSFPVPPASITGFSVSGGAPKLEDTVQDFPRNQDLTAYVGSLQFNRRNALHFRYRVVPDHPAWTSTSQTTLNLGKLRWGKHTLEVQGQLSTGPWSGTDILTFTVLKPIWFTWPVLAGFTLATGALVATGRRWRKKRKERAQKLLPELSEWRLTALSPELQQLQGAVLDSRFEVGRVLARGGFATIVEGRDLHRGGSPCAVKIFRQELTDKDWVSKHFRQEVMALEKIDHPNVVRIYGHGTTPRGAPYLVMERITGKTLREVLERGRLALPQIAGYLRQAGSALDEIHTHGVYHRDLKPENLMLREATVLEKQLVLIDFSIAIVQDPDETVHGLSRAAGTILYMAPEQALGYADSSTDIYSLAKILMEMLTGQRLSVLLPDASLDLPQRVRDFLKGMPLPLSWDSIQLLSSALEFDPSRRPKNAGEFATHIANDMERPRATA
ncbi:MAG: protein kinase [Terriglobia bacterium]